MSVRRRTLAAIAAAAGLLVAGGANAQAVKELRIGYQPSPIQDASIAMFETWGAKNGIKIVTNMGAANPWAAARKTAQIAASLGLSRLKIAAVMGDDVLEACKQHDLPLIEIDPRYFRPTEVDNLLGDASKAERILGWKHETEVRELARQMVESDLAAMKARPGDFRP